jgi:integrase/recombinase XerC
MIEDYELHLIAAGRMPSTIRLRIYQLERLADRVPLATATPDDLHRELARVRHLSANTRHGTIAAWRGFYRWAFESGLIESDPTSRLAQVRVPVRIPRLAPDDSIRRALTTSTPRDRALIGLARLACLRLAELTHLHTSAHRGDLLVVRGKGDKERTVFVNDDLALILRAHVAQLDDPHGYYFPGRVDVTLHTMSVYKIIQRATGCNPHSLRHAGATAAYRSTRNLRAVQVMLGHSSLETTQRYLHLADDELRRAAAGTALTPVFA